MRTRYAFIPKEKAEEAGMDTSLYREVNGSLVIPESKAGGLDGVTLYTNKEIKEFINKEENGTDNSIRTGAH